MTLLSFADEHKNFVLICKFGALRCGGVACIDPGFKTAEQGGDVGKTVFDQDERRTGARFFIRSGTVGDDPRIWVEFCEAGFDLCSGDVDCTGNVLPGEGFG